MDLLGEVEWKNKRKTLNLLDVVGTSERGKEDDRISEGIPGFQFWIKNSICCDKREREP